MDKDALVISKRLKFPLNDRTDRNIIVCLEMNLQSCKGTPDSLKQRFKGSERKLSLGATDYYIVQDDAREENKSLQIVVAVALQIYLFIDYCTYSNLDTMMSMPHQHSPGLVSRSREQFEHLHLRKY